MQDMNEFRIIGKILEADLDADGQLHLTLKNSNSFWAETAVRRLRQLKGQVLKLDVNEWKPKQRREEDPEKDNELIPARP